VAYPTFIQPQVTVVSPPSKYLRNTPNYWAPQCLTVSHPNKPSWTNRGKIIDAGRKLLTSYTPESLNWIFQNFNTMYRYIRDIVIFQSVSERHHDEITMIKLWPTFYPTSTQKLLDLCSPSYSVLRPWFNCCKSHQPFSWRFPGVTHSSKLPEPIHAIDYVGNVTPHAEIQNDRPIGGVWACGRDITVASFVVFLFCDPKFCSCPETKV